MSNKKKYNAPVQFYNTSNLNTAFGGTNGFATDIGSVVFNTVTNSLSIYNGSTWEGIKEATNGRIITVDKSNVNATDTRSGISKYSTIYPFLTIQAAVDAFIVGTDGYIHIKTGTYTENVSTSKDGLTLYYDNAVHTGGTVPALSITNGNSGGSTLSIVMLNSIIQNTGNASDRVTSSAIYTSSAGNISIQGFGTYGNDSYGSVIQSTEAAAVCAVLTSTRTLAVNNMHLKSTNYFALVPFNDDSNLVIRNSFLESINAAAIALSGQTGFGPGPKIYDSKIVGSTYGINFNCGAGEIFDTYIEATNGNAIGSATGLGGSSSFTFLISSCYIKSKNNAYAFSTGNGSLEYHIKMVNTTCDIASSNTTFDFPLSINPSSEISFYNVVSNRSWQAPSGYLGKITHYYNRFAEVSYLSNEFLNGDFRIDNEGMYVGAAGTSGSIALEVDASNKALLVSRTSAVANITTPYNGMIVHATESYGTSGLTNDDVYAYAANSWRSLTRNKMVEQFIQGNVVIDLSQGDFFKLTLVANVTSFSFVNEVIGRQYVFIFIKTTTQKTLLWASGKYYFSFGNSITLTDPTTNGTFPPTSRDIVTAICRETGRLDIVVTPNMLPN